MKLKNYTWQDVALDHFLTNKKMVAEVATGAGKTYFAIQTIKEIQKKENIRVLIVCPKIVILNNWNKELLDNGFTLFQVGLYYGEIKNYSNITITTTASVFNMKLDIFDFIIFDEVHNTFTKKFEKVYNKNWKYMLGLTATLNNEDETKHFKFMEYFNYNKYVFTTKEALNSNIINDFEFINYGFKITDEKTYEKYHDVEDRLLKLYRGVGSYHKIIRQEWSRKIFYSLLDKRKKIIYMYPERYKLLERILLENKNKKIIIFNEYNEAAREIYLSCLDLDLSARVVNSDLERFKVDNLIDDYKKNKYNILITSKMFDEGYNLPAIDVAIIFSGDSTKRQFIQRMGRVLRKKETKSKIYQLYCEGTFEERYAKNRLNIVKQIKAGEIND